MTKVDVEKIKAENKLLTNKIAELRNFVWDKYPDNQGEMIACPYSVLCYLEDYLSDIKRRLET